MVRRRLEVDTCLGVVVEQSLYDEQLKLIARAKLDDHRQDPDSGIVLPRRLQLEWPEAEIKLTIRLHQVEVNPANTPASTWQLPHGLGAGTFDLGTRRVLR